jgi:hypothetical protein
MGTGRTSSLARCLTAFLVGVAGVGPLPVDFGAGLGEGDLAPAGSPGRQRRLGLGDEQHPVLVPDQVPGPDIDQVRAAPGDRQEVRDVLSPPGRRLRSQDTTSVTPPAKSSASRNRCSSRLSNPRPGPGPCRSPGRQPPRRHDVRGPAPVFPVFTHASSRRAASQAS